MYTVMRSMRRLKNTIRIAEAVVYRKMSPIQIARRYNKSIRRIERVLCVDLRRVNYDLFQLVSTELARQGYIKQAKYKI